MRLRYLCHQGFVVDRLRFFSNVTCSIWKILAIEKAMATPVP